MSTNQEIIGGLKDNGRSLVIMAVACALIVTPSIVFFVLFTWLKLEPPQLQLYQITLGAFSFLLIAGYVTFSVPHKFHCKDGVIEFFPILGPKQSKKISDIKKIFVLRDRYGSKNSYFRVIVFNWLNIFAFDFGGSVMDGSNELFEHLKTVVPEEKWKL